MAWTDIAVCNLAIGKVSGDAIEALSEDSPLGVFCAEQYPHRREVLLGAYRWTFANRIAPLAQLEIGPSEAAAGAYKFARPADLLGAVHDWRDQPDPDGATRRFVLDHDGAFWADKRPVFAEFTAAVGEERWPPWFRNLVVTAFAADVAHHCQNARLAQQLHQTAFGTPQEEGRGGLFGAAMNEDARMAPQRQLVSGVDAGPLVGVRYGGGLFGHVRGVVASEA